MPISVLSTRHLSTEAIAIIKAAQWHLQVVPMVETKGAPDNWQDLFWDTFRQSAADRLLLFSSRRAVECIHEACMARGIVFPEGTQAAGVGKKTMDAAVSYLQVVPAFVARNAQVLSDLIINAVSNLTTIFYFCGNSRLDILSKRLLHAGFQIKEYTVYHTRLTPVSLDQPYHVVLFFSPSGVESFFQRNTWKQAMIALSIGETTAAALRACGVSQIWIADEPDELSMIKKLKQIFQTQQ